MPNERTLRFVTQASRNGGLFVLYEYLTEMLTLERSLNALSRVQLETLNSLQEGVAVFGVDGRIRLYHPAFLRILKMNGMVLLEHPHIDGLQVFSQARVPDLRGWDAVKSRITGTEADREMYILRVQCKDNMVIDCTIAPLPDGAAL